MGERLSVGVADDVAAGNGLGAPGRREAAARFSHGGSLPSPTTFVTALAATLDSCPNNRILAAVERADPIVGSLIGA
jgi:hypothetical protein